MDELPTPHHLSPHFFLAQAKMSTKMGRDRKKRNRKKREMRGGDGWEEDKRKGSSSVRGGAKQRAVWVL